MPVIQIGQTPGEEDCAQVGSKLYDYPELARIEARAYMVGLRKKFGEPPEGATLFIKGTPHDYGTYYEAALRYDTSVPAAVDYAMKVEDGFGRWDEVNMWPPVTYDEKGNALNILRKQESWDREKNPEARNIVE